MVIGIPEPKDAYVVRWTYMKRGHTYPQKAQRTFRYGPLSMPSKKQEAYNYALQKKANAEVIEVKFFNVRLAVDDLTDWLEGDN